MKRLFMIVIGLLCLSCAYSINVDDIWGVWNLGDKDDAIYNAQISLGTYQRTGNFLKFDPNDGRERTIKYDGGLYRINAIEPQENSVLLFLEYDGLIKQPTGKWNKGIVSGVVVMHFLDKNSVWFEIVPEKTDSSFSEADFRGMSTVYWRANKIK